MIKNLKFYFLLNQLEIPYIEVMKSLGNLVKAYLYESINLEDFLSFISENFQDIGNNSSVNSEIESECLDNDEKSILKSKFLNSIFSPGINTVSVEIYKSKKSSKIEVFKLIQKDHCYLNAEEPVLRNQKFEVKLLNSIMEVTNIEEIEIKSGFSIKKVNEFYQKNYPKAVLFNTNFSRLIIEELDPKTLAFLTEYFSFLKNVNDKLLFIHYLNRHGLYLEFLKVALVAIKFEENTSLLVYILQHTGIILNSIFGGFNKFEFENKKLKEEKIEGFLHGKNIKKDPSRHRKGRSKHYDGVMMNDSRNKIFFAVIDRLKEEKREHVKRAIISVISPLIDYKVSKMYIIEEEWRFSPKIGDEIIEILTEIMKLKMIIHDNGKKKSFSRCFKKIKRSHSLEITGNIHPFTTIQKLEKNINIVDFEKSSTILQKVKYRKELREEDYVEYFEKMYDLIKTRPAIYLVEVYFPLLIPGGTKFTTCVSEFCDILDKENLAEYSVQLKLLTEELIKRLDVCHQIREEMS